MMGKFIKTYVINLEKRKERKSHASAQFLNEKYYLLNFVKAIENVNGALGLWQTIVQIIQNSYIREDDYILICEDDHEFTKKYNIQKLLSAIKEAEEKKADVLLGGVSWFLDALQTSKNLFWIDQFTGTQFMIVFKKFYKKIINADFNVGDTADRKICELTTSKFLVYPFISVQKEFGYSDATPFNNKEGYVTEIFEKSDMILSHIIQANNFYQKNL